MIFKSSTISPKGRNKYGNYTSSKNVTSKVVKTIYAGNSSTNELGNGADNKTPDEEAKNYLLFLQKTSTSFDGGAVALQSQSASTLLIGYKGTEKADTYIGVLTGSTAEQNYGIIGLPVSGMSVSVSNNGSKNTELVISVNSAITQNQGSLSIPCALYMKSNSSTILDNDFSAWKSETDNCLIMYLDFSWSISNNAQSTYVLDLTNENAGINCDSNGNILSGAVRPTCTASLYYGTDEVEECTYSISYPSSQSVAGVSINTNTGELTFGSNFTFIGTSLEVCVSATYLGEVVARKIMTISKSYAGVDGKSVSRWIVLSANSVHINPNTNPVVAVPSQITAYVMKQENENQPVRDNETTIYYDFNSSTPASIYTSAVQIDVTKSYLTFGLKNSSNVIYETETIPILKDGSNGQDGQDGADGEDGQDGQSVYRLDLTNENASINADCNGNILRNAIRPTCKATLYYGTNGVSNVNYRLISVPSHCSGVSINSTSGQLTFNSGTSSTPFTFTGTSIEIMIGAYKNNTLYGSSIMTISKAFAGANGEDGQDGQDGADGNDAISYWLIPSVDKVIKKANGTFIPSYVNVNAYKQVGDREPVSATDCHIYYGFDVQNPVTLYSGSITIQQNKSFLMLQLKNANGNVVDRESIPILQDGKDGEDGEQGLKGAAIRGAVDYYTQTTTRRWCNGVYNANYAEDALWIDVILKDGNYYYCNTSYNGSANDDWNLVSSNWTLGTEQLDFVATKLLLADNAQINFLSTNGLYLYNDDGDAIVGGCVGGENINFFAGSSTPSSAPFRVNYNGSMVAQSGSFGCLTIGNDRGRNMLYGEATEPYDDEYLHSIQVEPELIKIQAEYSGEEDDDFQSVTIAPLADYDRVDISGVIDVYAGNDSTGLPRKGFNTDGYVVANNFINSKGEYAISSQLPNISVIFVISTTSTGGTFSKGSTFWNVNGVCSNVSVVRYPYVKCCTQSDITSKGWDTKYLNQFVYYNGYNMCPTGYAYTSVVKQNGIIYITLS